MYTANYTEYKGNFYIVDERVRIVMGKIKKKTSFLARVCAVVCTAALLVLPSDGATGKNAYGSSAMGDLQAQIDKLQKENADRQSQIENLDSSIKDNEETMGLVSDHIDGVNDEITKYGQLIIAKQENINAKKSEIAAVEEKITQKEQEIEEKNSDIAEMQAQNKRNLEKFSKLARALYMTDASSTLPILNGSDDWYNYYVYSDVVKNISGQNVKFMKDLLSSIDEQEQMIKDLNAEIDGLEQDKKDLQKQKEELEDEMTALEGEKTDLESYASQQKNYLYGLAAENESLKDKIDGLEYDISVSNSKLDALDKELQELIRKAQQDGTGSQIAYTDGFRWPLEPQFHYIITYFGWDNNFGGRNHGGIDIIGSSVSISSANIYAAQSGTVIKVSNTCPHDYGKYYSCGCGGGWGNYIIIDHGGGLSTLYAHCRKIYVYEGQQVTKGDVVGLVGTTGWSTGEHLHFEVRENGYRVDPLGYDYYDVY